MVWANNQTWVASAWVLLKQLFSCPEYVKSTQIFFYVRWSFESAYSNICVHTHKCIHIQDIYKRMARFQKLTRNLFLTLHGHNLHRQQQQLSKFLMRYQQLTSHAYWGAAGPVSKMASQQEKAQFRKGSPATCVFSKPCMKLTLHCNHRPGHLKTENTESLFLLRRHLGNWPRSKHEKWTAGSAWETWTVAAADGVGCARVRCEVNFLLTFETAPFFCVYPVNNYAHACMCTYSIYVHKYIHIHTFQL